MPTPPNPASPERDLYEAATARHQAGDFAGAEALYARFLARVPDDLAALNNAALAAKSLGRTARALRRLETAVRCHPAAPEAHFNLGNLLQEQGRIEPALAAYDRAIALKPDYTKVYFNRGNALERLGRRDEALASRELAMAFVTNAALFEAQRKCDWAEVERLKPVMRAATDRALGEGRICGEGAYESLTRDASPPRNHAMAQLMASTLGMRGPKPAAVPIERTAGDKIHLGYISADFREHPVAQVMAGVFKRHDRHGFVVSVYSYGIDDRSPWRRRIAAECDHFVDLHGMSDAEAAHRIRSDGVDILIDLTVWTENTRPKICALRPAPVQIQYLGFPGTSGSTAHDYAIVDATVVPPDERAFWDEALIILPHSYFVVDRDQPVAATGLRRRDCGLLEDGVVFCSFNQSYKIEPVAFDAWAKLLAAVPASVLWLPELPVARANLRREATRRGIAADRLLFAPRLAEKAQHLERLALADIALDTLAYNGHTTTSDALSVGVPVVTVAGNHFPSRVSASLLQAAGLGALIARDVEDYIGRALALARAPEERRRVRAQLVAAKLDAPLFDADASVAALEAGYRRAWEIRLAGAEPADIRL